MTETHKAQRGKHVYGYLKKNFTLYNCSYKVVRMQYVLHTGTVVVIIQFSSKKYFIDPQREIFIPRIWPSDCCRGPQHYRILNAR